MFRLSRELILRSPQYMNACGEYEIDLRGNKLTVIENLGITENQFDSVDLSDNEIVKLEGFPLLPRLKTILLNNNRISRIAKNLEASIPNVETLVLTGNKISNVSVRPSLFLFVLDLSECTYFLSLSLSFWTFLFFLSVCTGSRKPEGSQKAETLGTFRKCSYKAAKL